MNVTLPIVARELRVRARLRATWWMRVVVGLLAFLSVLWVFLLPAPAGSPSQRGRYAFTLVSWLLFLFCLLEGLRLTHDTLSRERREGTLGLLFLTELRGQDVFLGKLSACGWSAFQGVLAIIPVLAASLLLGGVTGGEVTRTALALLNTLFAALALGLWVSAGQEDDGRALGRSLGWMLAWVGLPWVAEMPWRMLLGGPTSGFSPAVLSPLTSFALADASSFQAPPFWASLFAIHGTGWLLVALGARRTAWCWRHGNGEASAPSAPVLPPVLSHSGAVGERPMVWLVTRLPGQQGRAWWGCLLLGVSPLLSLLITLLAGRGGATMRMAAILSLGTLLCSLAGIVLLASLAAQPIRELRRTGLVELLFTTPLSAPELGADCWRALWRTTRLPLVAMVGSGLVVRFVLPLFQGNVVISFGGGLGLAMVVIKPVLLLLAILQAGLWFGASSRKPGQATMRTVVFVWLLPFLALRVLPLHLMFGWLFPFTPTLYALIYQAMPAAYDLAFFLWARKRFRSRLRQALLRDPLVAAEPPPPDAGLRGVIRWARNWQAD